MGFRKTSIALSTEQVDSPLPRIGEEKEGQVWDGDKWVSKSDWEASVAPVESEPDPVEAEQKG
jgi:hypothetical protein